MQQQKCVLWLKAICTAWRSNPVTALTFELLTEYLSQFSCNYHNNVSFLEAMIFLTLKIVLAQATDTRKEIISNVTTILCQPAARSFFFSGKKCKQEVVVCVLLLSSIFAQSINLSSAQLRELQTQTTANTEPQ
jgi:hypothetical protein